MKNNNLSISNASIQYSSTIPPSKLHINLDYLANDGISITAYNNTFDFTKEQVLQLIKNLQLFANDNFEITNPSKW